MGCGGRRKKFFKTFTAEVAETAEKKQVEIQLKKSKQFSHRGHGGHRVLKTQISMDYPPKGREAPLIQEIVFLFSVFIPLCSL
jgi:hypothetical protein